MKIRGLLSQLLAPGHGFCPRCQTSWKYAKGHSVAYDKGQGCFPLCEDCWWESSLSEKIEYYVGRITRNAIQYGGSPPLNSQIEFLTKNIEASHYALRPGTRVNFEWFPVNGSYISDGETKFNWTIYSGTIETVEGLKHESEHSRLRHPLALYYHIKPDIETLSGCATINEDGTKTYSSICCCVHSIIGTPCDCSLISILIHGCQKHL